MALALFLVLTAGAYIVFRHGPPVFAQTRGCCKERDTFSVPWRKNGLSFESCEQLNQRRDRDNVREERGFVWWDDRCS
jgi:hypothetical protein